MIKAHEIQGCIALENSFNKVGLDHVVLVKWLRRGGEQLLGLTPRATVNALSLAWVDGQSLRTYRHAPTRLAQELAAATHSRAVRLALMARTAKWATLRTHREYMGFYDVSFRTGVQIPAPYGSYVMENCCSKSVIRRSFTRKPPWKRR